MSLAWQVPSALATSPKIDVILMDILMQRTDGSAVCSELRQQGNKLPIVAMTGACAFFPRLAPVLFPL